MRILVVNDDGIQAPGIRKLAELARQFASVPRNVPPDHGGRRFGDRPG